MLVKATFMPSIEDNPEVLEEACKKFQEAIENNPMNISLYTDGDDFIGSSVRAYVEDDHIVVEYDCKEEYKESLIKEGFIVE